MTLISERFIDRARLPGIPATGPVALRHHYDPVMYRNLYILPL